MLYEVLNRFRLIGLCNHAAVVIHSSIINYRSDDVQMAMSLPFQWFIPDSTIRELQLLTRSQLFGNRAQNLLNLIHTTMAAGKGRIIDRNVEDLYQLDGAPAATRKDFYDGGLVFIFGDMGKMAEFIEKTPVDFDIHVLFNPHWKCSDVSGCEIWSLPVAKRMLANLPWKQANVLENTVKVSNPIKNIKVIRAYDKNQNEVARFSGSTLEKVKNMAGGEGVIYTSPSMPGRLLKFYRNNLPKGNRLKKIRAICGLPLPHVAFPQELLYDESGNLIGIAMNPCPGRSLADVKAMGWQGYDPDAVIRNLALVLLELHALHIMVGDLAEQNVLVDQNNQVYLVDTDSFQLQNYPSGGVRSEYCHRDVKLNELNSALRQPQHEDFAWSVLLFHIVCWENPVMQKRAVDDDRQLCWQTFSFPLEAADIQNNRVNEELFEIWKQQPMVLRKQFSEEFHFRRSHPIGSWLKALEL